MKRLSLITCLATLLLPLVPVRASESGSVHFTTDVIPILTKLGCNGGGCHGKATGQNGFKLSLWGFEPQADYRALVKESRGRRISPSVPDQSLFLLKATNTKPHGGGMRTSVDSDEYRVLRQWIANGAVPPSEHDPKLQQLEVTPSQLDFSINAKHALTVTASYSDGTTRDVSQGALYFSNAKKIASVTHDGIVHTNMHSGLFAVMVRFGGKVATFHGAVPRQNRVDEEALVTSRLDQLESQLRSPPTIDDTPPTSRQVDRLLIQQWKRLGILPSQPSNAETFVRRVTLDICGTLPTRQEVEDYLNDERADKRAKLINRLLDRPEYAVYFSLKWADILKNRGSGYGTSKQRAGTALFSGWIRNAIATNKPYDRFVGEILTASGNQNQIPPAIWYRSVRTLPDYVESVAQAFLGVRIQCAQCHHHPFERWSQQDYFSLAAVFARVGRKGGFADAEVPTSEVIYLKEKGDVFHPRTGDLLQPRPLGGPDFELGPFDDPRKSLAHWMIQPENPYFARTMVNRIWAHFLGRGIIDPIDDARSTNPPSNPELLDALASDFTQSGFDVKHLIRVICNSSAYGADSTPNQFNQNDEQTFARFYPRRLTAEVLLDGISQVLEVPTQFSGGKGKFPAGTRAIELPDENIPAHFLDVFGRPARTSACECERIDEASLAQALELVNSSEINRKLTDENGLVGRLAANTLAHAVNVEEIFLRYFARHPQPNELATAVEFLETEEDRAEAYRSLLWSLLATNEFMFNH